MLRVVLGSVSNYNMDENAILKKLKLTTGQIALSFALCNFPVAIQLFPKFELSSM